MKTKHLILFIVSFIAILFYNSCRKEYSGELVFWYGKSTSEKLLENNITSLTFYLDNEVVGSSAANVYWTEAPDCGANASVTATKDLGNVETQSYSYKVVDQYGNTIWDGVVNINANTCSKLQLSWNN